MKRSLEKVVALFFVFGFLFIPLTFNGKDWQFELTNFLFSKPITFFQNLIFSKSLQNIDFSSDTIALNLLLILLFIISILIVSISNFNSDKIIKSSRIISCYYISFILLKYGFDKIFKAQFYLPEPNILYTNFGNLSKDILYWSTIGTSHFYSVSIGIIEVLVAVLILIKPTRILGLLLAIGVFVNIILINFGFDISVKTFSIFLLLATLFAIYSSLKSIINFLVFQKNQQLVSENKSFLKYPIFTIWFKINIVGLMLLQILYPYFKSNNFNDDNQKRPFLHGVYQVNQIIKNNDTLETSDFPIQKIFIHRNNYIIFQDQKNQMTDYHFENHKLNNQLILEDYQNNQIKVNFEFSPKDSTFKLKFKNLNIISKTINWNELPALQNQTHYTIDQIQ